MSLKVVQRTPSRIVFDTGEWFDPSKANFFPDDKAENGLFTTTLWCTQNGQWFAQDISKMRTGESSNAEGSWYKLKLKEAAARLIVNGYEAPEGIDYDYLKV